MLGLPPEPMSDFLSLIAHHGYIIIFVTVFLEAIGLPVSAALALVAGGAAAASGILRAPVVLPLAVVGMLLGDSLLYVLGSHMGWALLGFLCKVSANPETCILRSAESFYKRGRLTLLIAKFIPGVNTMAPPLAGSMKMPFGQFLGLDLAGASFYALAYGTVGFLFRDFVAAIARGFQAAGHAAEIVAIFALTCLHCLPHRALQQASRLPHCATGPSDRIGKETSVGGLRAKFCSLMCAAMVTTIPTLLVSGARFESNPITYPRKLTSFLKIRIFICTALACARPPAPVWRIYFASRDLMRL